MWLQLCVIVQPSSNLHAAGCFFMHTHIHRHAHPDNNTYIRTQNNTSLLSAYTCLHLNFKVNKIFEYLYNSLIFLIGIQSSLLIQNGAMWSRHKSWDWTPTNFGFQVLCFTLRGTCIHLYWIFIYIFTYVIKVAIFWDIAQYNPYVNRRFGGTYRIATCWKLIYFSADFRPWRWRWYITPKSRFTYGLYGVLSQKMAVLTTTAARA
jgi:hypothetical protein